MYEFVTDPAIMLCILVIIGLIISIIPVLSDHYYFEGIVVYIIIIALLVTLAIIWQPPDWLKLE